MWTGVRAINPIWMRSAVGMNADRQQTFWKVIIPASFPYMITGVRLSFGRAWMAVIGAELLAATDWGLGRLVFESKEWLTIDVMLNTLVVIGLLGLFFEKAIFQTIDRMTVQRWGIVKESD
jgi:NitT/TauT family transport system permease protein